MIAITLKPFFYKGAGQMGICFKNDAAVNLLVRKINNVRWSKTHSCWYLPLCKENHTALVDGIGN